MKKMLVLFLFSFGFFAPVFGIEDDVFNSTLLISSNIDREVSRINYQIAKNKREIARIQASRDLSYNEKKRMIRKLEYEIYRQKQAVRHIRV